MSNTPNNETQKHTTPTPEAKKKQQRTIVIGVVAVLAIVIVVMAVLLINGGKNSQQTTSPLYPNGVLPTSGTRHDVDLLPNGGKDAMEVSGLWRLDQITLYEFDGYGRGIMHTAVDDYSFAYSAQDGVLEIDFDVDNGRDIEYHYVISGDSMTLTSGDASYKFTKE